MTKSLTRLLLVLAPLVALVRFSDRTARDAGRWFDEADEVWEPFLVDDDALAPAAGPHGTRLA